MVLRCVLILLLVKSFVSCQHYLQSDLNKDMRVKHQPRMSLPFVVEVFLQDHTFKLSVRGLQCLLQESWDDTLAKLPLRIPSCPNLVVLHVVLTLDFYLFMSCCCASLLQVPAADTVSNRLPIPPPAPRVRSHFLF